MIDLKKYSDLTLISLLKTSDHSAYTEIYNRYNFLLIAFAYRKLRDEELAKDFVQEIFTTLWHKRDTLQETGNLSSYLYISLRSRILDHFKHQDVQTKYIDDLKYGFLTINYAQTDYLSRERSLNEYIEKQIMSLPKKMRIVFLMSREKHLSHKQIAKIMNTSEENVSKHITRALKSLKAKLTVWLF